MARMAKKPGKAGDAVNYMTRNQAIKRLQLSLADFRRLCILKGVYPRDPKKKVKGRDKTYYATKDILFLLHEPVLEKLREMKAHRKKVVKAKARKDKFKVKLLHENKPFYLLDHLVKERFPTFTDAVRDMDDALSMATLFAGLPSTDSIDPKRVINCRRLCLEFCSYVIKSGALKKVFLSIKGCYFQAQIEGQMVTWLAPYEFGQDMPVDVDYRVMMTFLEFYETQLHFINYRLYSKIGLKYPPRIDTKLDGLHAGLRAIVLESKDGKEGEDVEKIEAGETGKKNQGKGSQRIKTLKGKLAKIAGQEEGDGMEEEGLEEDLDAEMQGEEDEEGEAQDEGEGGLFKGLVFFISRECSRGLFEIMIRAQGGTVGWEGFGTPFEETDERITHQLVDRDSQRHQFLAREYVQPQWVADCLNSSLLLPVLPYRPGVAPPAHISPFVDDEEEGYVPDQRKFILELQQQAKGHAGAFDEQEGAENGAEDKEEEDKSEEGDEEDEEEDDEEEEKFAAELEAEKGAKEEAAEGVQTRGEKGKRKKEGMTEEERQRLMMPKKDKRLYDKIMFAKQRKADRAQQLKDRKPNKA